MSDYLTQLISRTLGLTPVAEPLVAPLFGPGKTSMAVAHPDEFADEPQALPDPEINPVRLHKPSAPPLKTADQPVVRPSPSEQLQGTASQTLAVGERNPALDSSISDEIGSKPVEGPPKQAYRSEWVLEETLLQPSAPLLAQKRFSGVTMSAKAAEKTERKSSSPPLESIQQLEEPSALSDEARPISSRRTTGLSSTKTLAAPLLVPLPPDEISSPREDLPVVRRQPIKAATSRDKEAPATIEITIGRVEVHAVHQPVPAARTKATGPIPPHLSLEEYLRNQNGGRR